MQAYVINLNARTDRWDAVLSQWNHQELPLSRIEAVESNSIPLVESTFLPPPVIANWKSHCKTYRKFLATNDSYALILEDDFQLNLIDIDKFVAICVSNDLDFLQLGYLNNSILDRLSVRVTNFQDSVLKIMCFASGIRLLPNFLSTKLLVVEQSQIPYSVVLNDARAGAHAYIISRRFAECMLSINHPTFLATDGLFIAISNLRFLKMGRLRKSRITQSNSPSSITSRFVSL